MTFYLQVYRLNCYVHFLFPLPVQLVLLASVTRYVSRRRVQIPKLHIFVIFCYFCGVTDLTLLAGLYALQNSLLYPCCVFHSSKLFKRKNKKLLWPFIWRINSNMFFVFNKWLLKHGKIQASRWIVLGKWGKAVKWGRSRIQDPRAWYRSITRKSPSCEYIL